MCERGTNWSYLATLQRHFLWLLLGKTSLSLFQCLKVLCWGTSATIMSMFVSVLSQVSPFQGKPQVIECVTNSGKATRATESFLWGTIQLKTIIITLRELWLPNAPFFVSQNQRDKSSKKIFENLKIIVFMTFCMIKLGSILTLLSITLLTVTVDSSLILHICRP